MKTNAEQRARLERIEQALKAPLPEFEAAKARLHFLCNSQASEAVDWRNSRMTDAIAQLEDARLRAVAAIHQLHDEARVLNEELLMGRSKSATLEQSPATKH